jgi:hypothetical protein
MEPVFILKRYIFGDDTTKDSEEFEVDSIKEEINTSKEENDINQTIIDSVDTLKTDIYKFKKVLFFNLVSNDTKHSPSNISAIVEYHSVYLQCIAYWISLLDSTKVPEPLLQDDLETMFQSLSKHILELSQSSSDAYTLVYSLLFQISTQHPFDLKPMTDDQ